MFTCGLSEEEPLNSILHLSAAMDSAVGFKSQNINNWSWVEGVGASAFQGQWKSVVHEGLLLTYKQSILTARESFGLLP